MTKASEILDINNTATFEAPMGELDFLVDTYGNETSLVEIQIPSTETVDSLIKTTLKAHLINLKLHTLATKKSMEIFKHGKINSVTVYMITPRLALGLNHQYWNFHRQEMISQHHFYKQASHLRISAT